jgi:uncharacterized protein YrrD
MCLASRSEHGGDKIGEVEDIVVNMVDSQVLFVTMNYSGGLFRSDKIYPVPVSAFSWIPLKRNFARFRGRGVARCTGL